MTSRSVPDARVLIVALGANDGLQGTPVATVRRNLEIIVERAKSRNLRVLLSGGARSYRGEPLRRERF